jgi:hypothetical protein
MRKQILVSLRLAPLAGAALALGCGAGSKSNGAPEAGLLPGMSTELDGANPGAEGSSTTGSGGNGSDAAPGPGNVSPGTDAEPSPNAGTVSLGDGSLPADAALLGDGGGGRYYLVSNQCTQTVWAAALPASTFPGGAVEMPPGYSFEVRVADGWSGRIWGKTQCTTTNGKLSCASDAFPASLAELTLTKTPATGLDFYDVSLVDGFNLPIELVAIGHTPDAGHPYDCGDPSCVQDLNATCPQPLIDQVNGVTIACANDECKVLGGNDAASPDCKYPNQYTEFFKTACPTAYSYPYDDPTSTFTCKGENSYAVVFCP